MALYVDIEKKCGDFELRVKFETEDEVFSILGASGCGKSLTLKCIAGIEKPDQGMIKLDDKVLFDSQKRINLPARKRRAGYLFQDYALFPNMNVLQNIICGAKSKEFAWELVERFYLKGKEKLYPAQLSGGQKQRVALARMLAAKPDVIMLDEPFSALDNYLKTRLEREIMDVLDSYDKPVLFVSHDRNEVYRLTDRIAVMDNGKIVDVQSKRELFGNPKTLAATLLTGCKNITRLAMTEDGSYQALDWGVQLRNERDMECTGKMRGKQNTQVWGKYRYAGFRAHYFEVVPDMEDANVLECQVLREIEDTFSTVILFRNRGCTATGDYSVLTFELPKEKWEQIRHDRIFLKIPVDQLIMLEK